MPLSASRADDTLRRRIILGEDDKNVRDSITRALTFEGYVVEAVSDGEQVLEAVHRTVPDLVILDVMMPRVDGLAACRRLRNDHRLLPILMVTARHEVADRVAGLDSGADDYLPKPFALDELLARVRALLRRSTPPADESSLVHFADIEMDLGSRRVTRAGLEVELTKTEFDLLQILMENSGIVLTREKIYEEIWGFDFETNSKSLDVYVGYLRRKLEPDDSPKLIHTVRGVGYVLRLT